MANKTKAQKYNEMLEAIFTKARETEPEYKVNKQTLLKVIEDLKEQKCFEYSKIIDNQDGGWTFDYRDGYVDGLAQVISVLNEFIKCHD